ncbi:MAG: hypothetical protein KAQ96_14635, partial [Thermoplasmata archaeon]|nr:hypothetical protein [Thermoplasmata archaeon]
VRMFWGKGIMSFRRMFKQMLKGSLVFAIVFLAIIWLLLLYGDEADLAEEGAPALEGYEIAIALVVMYIGLYFVGILIFLVGYVMCMGLVGIVYLLTVGFAPPFLRRVRNLTAGDRWYGGVLEWLFFIPDNLDTGTLSATAPVVEKEFPWARFKRAVAWQMIFALLIAVLVSLNPFLLEAVSIETLFTVMENAYIFVPMLFLPVLVVLRLRVKIEGPVKDFYIYVGIRTRLVRTFLAIGTLVLFIRLALKDLDPEMLLLRMTGYFFMAIILISTFTWLYFNIVENQLAFKVIERAPWLVDGEEADEADGDPGEGVEDVPEEMPDPVPTGT